MTGEPMVIVSADTHVGPRLAEDLRPYCPAAHRDDFDRFTAEAASLKESVAGFASFLLEHPNAKTAGHHDSEARLADYDHDGVAAGVLFHGSQNFEPLPFGPLLPHGQPADPALAAVGLDVYNRWLADFVAADPVRHVGLAYVPADDVAAAVTTAEWAHDHGLKGINFPALRDRGVLEYNDPAWDPFWSVCEERGLPLVTHVGARGSNRYEGPEATAIQAIETGTFWSHRAIWWLTFGGVFERFPGLRYLIAETPGNWYPSLADELDAIWTMFTTERALNAAFLEKVPRPPSEYLAANVFFGASFCSPFEAEQAVTWGFASQLLWGSDYPHLEGTFVNPEGEDQPSVTRLALRNTFSGLPGDEVRRMVGGNAIEVFDLDGDALAGVATAIGAPTAEDLDQPIDAVPEGASLHAFRSGTTAWS